MAVVVTRDGDRWPGSIIGFTIERDDFTKTEIETIERAVNHWNDRTDWTLRPRSRQRDYVTFRRGEKCSSHVGRRGGQQFVNLTKNCGTAAAIHEIGHAVGFHHEHNRLDRDQRIVVIHSRIDPNGRHNFARVDPTRAVDHGNYDYRSIMHYGPNFLVRKQRYVWRRGWGNVRPFTSGDQLAVSAFNHDDREWGTWALDRTVGIAHRLQRLPVTVDWDVFEPYTVDGTAYVLLLRTRDGRVDVYRMDDQGRFDVGVDHRDWSSGWTHAQVWPGRDRPYLLIHKQENGEVHTHRILKSGRVGSEVQRLNFDPGFDTVRRYSVGNDDYLLLLNSQTGRMNVRRLEYNGRVSDPIQTDNWTQGWDNAAYWTAGAKTFILIVKSSTGDTHAHAIRTDGTVGRRTDTRDWSSGWTTTEAFYHLGTSVLILLKERSGDIHLHTLESDGRIGEELPMNPAVTLVGPPGVTFGNRLSLSAGDIAAANELAR